MPTAKNLKASAAKASKGKKNSPVKPHAAAKPVAIASEAPKKKVKALFKGDEKLGTYLRKILVQVHPRVSISRDAMDAINSLALDIYRKLATSAADLSRKGKLGKNGMQPALTARDVQTAVKLSLPGELSAHAVSAGAEAVTKYKLSRVVSK